MVDGTPTNNQLGVFTFGDLGLKWKHRAFASYGRSPWTLALTQIFRSGYDNQQLPGVKAGTSIRPTIATGSTDM